MRWASLHLCLLASFGGVSPLAAVEAPPVTHQLRAASGSSPRPAECSPSSGRVGRGHTLWDRARDPRLVEYCNALARGYSRLASQPGDSLRAAKQAAEAEPGRIAPLLLQGQALVALGQQGQAYDVFRKAFEQQPELRLSPEALHAYALAAVGSGHQQAALTAYRRLVPTAGLLTRVGAGESVYIEAAVLVMLSQPDQLQEAVAYLNEARRRNATPTLSPYILAALALALDRQGRAEESRGVAGEARGRIAQMLASIESEAPRSRVLLPQLSQVELLAMVGVLAASEDAALAKEYWKDFVEQAPADHPWRAHAVAKLERGR